MVVNSILMALRRKFMQTGISRFIVGRLRSFRHVSLMPLEGHHYCTSWTSLPIANPLKIWSRRVSALNMEQSAGYFDSQLQTRRRPIFARAHFLLPDQVAYILCQYWCAESDTLHKPILFRYLAMLNRTRWLKQVAHHRRPL